MNEKSLRRRPWWLVLVLAVGVIAAPVLIHFGPVVWSSAPADTSAEARPAGRAALVCLGHVDVEDGVTALNPMQPGRVVEVAVREGQTVKAGAVLIRLDDQQARLVVRQAEGELKVARARLAQALKLPQQHQAEQVILAEAEVDARQARLEEARHALAERVVCAPAEGEVLRLLVAVGDVAGPQGRQAALLFCPRRPRIIRAEVPQEFADRVRVSQAVLIQDDARLVEVGRGHVARLSDWFTQRRSVLQELAIRNDVRTLECIIRIEPSGMPLRIGLRVRVVIAVLADASG